MRKRMMAALAAATMLAAGTAAPIAASAEWLQAKTRHFIIYSDDTPDALRAYAEKLERFDDGVRKLRGMRADTVSDANKVTIYVTPNTAELNRLLGSGGGIGGVYMGRAAGPVAFVPKSIGTGSGSKFEFTPDLVFFHEYSHHLQLQDVQVALPAWMVEGYAEFYGTATFREDGSLVIGAPANTRSDALYHDDLPMDALLGNTIDVDMVSPLLFYGKSWLLTHYLAFSDARKGQLSQYVKNLGAGQDAVTAAKNAFGNLNKLDGELHGYMRGKMPQMVIDAKLMNAGPVEVRALRPGEAAAMKIRFQTDAGVNRSISGALADTAMGIVSRYPGDAFVLLAAAEAAFDAKRFQQAADLAQRALAIEPKNIDALVLRGRALTGVAMQGGARENWAEARRLFERASAIDPDAADPLYRLYRSYKLAKEKPTPIAVGALIAAFATVPQDDDLRADLARQFALDGRMAEARMVFAPLAYDPHVRGKRKERLGKIMAAMKAGDGAGAVRLFDDIEAEQAKQAKRKPGDDA